MTQLPLLIDYVDRLVALGVDSLILADLGLLRSLKKRHGQIEYHASTLAHLTNSGSVRFMAGQGVQRVVLPRHLSVADMASIVAPGAGHSLRCFFAGRQMPEFRRAVHLSPFQPGKDLAV